MDNKLYETLNRIPGLFGIVAAMIFAIIIILTFIVRIFQFPHLLQRYFNVEKSQSVPTRIFKMIVLLLLTAGLIGVFSYNVYKMIHDPPKLSVTVGKSKESPSMLICPINNFNFATARYYSSFNSFVNNPEQNFGLNNDFKPFQRYDNINCTFFNSTLSSMTKDISGGFYLFGFTSLLQSSQGNKFSDVGFLLSSKSGIFQYTETRHKALNGSYRGFQIYSIGNFEFSGISVDGATPQPSTWIGLIAPINVITQVEEPSLTLADLLSNVGGYLSIWGIFGFLFGSKKMKPFGFVSHFVFMKQDMKKLRKELENMKGDKLNNLKKDEIVVDNVTKMNNQSELKNLLAKYYVDMNFYEYASMYA